LKIARFLNDNKPQWAVMKNDKWFWTSGELFQEKFQETDEEVMGEPVYLPPCDCSKIICVGLNYRDHIREMKHDMPAEPVIFLKPPTAVVGHGGEIVIPHGARRVDYEAELAIVIGKKAKCVPVSEAKEYIFGYTCLNDVTEREIQKRDGQWTRAKGFDTFAPVGPCIETELDPENLDISLTVNGTEHQHSNTSNFIFRIDEIVSFVSGVMTLFPGDIISTGTPSGIGPLFPGDTVTVSIEGIGELANHVR
jgi:2-keto-4-pentenoate hydratase/2-oxohepta-3-ene-1,7-dioic acid hydratase in catechol pathway